MSRKYGKVYKLSKNFEDYSYIINGIGGIGKTTMVYEIGKLITGSNEGTFIITCGVENKPKHIDDAFGDVAPDFKTFVDIVKELCDNKEEYQDTRFVAIDSMDEFTRITENYVVAEWNKTCDINDRAKSISQAYKGFQKGENRVCDLMLQQVMKLQSAGYSLLLVGHTKTKLKEDEITKVQYEQLTCNLDNKYYNTLKDKVNLVVMCFNESVIENVEEKKNAFTKKMNKVGQLTDRKRVMVFADTDNAIDTKTHFPYIVAKADFGAQNFIDAVKDALEEQSKHNGETPAPKKTTKKTTKKAELEEESVVEENPMVVEDVAPWDDPDIDNEEKTEVDDIFESEEETLEEDFDVASALDSIRGAFKTADLDTKKKVKALLNGGKLSEDIPVETLKEIMEVLDI